MRNVEPNPELGNFTSALLGNFQSALTPPRSRPNDGVFWQSPNPGFPDREPSPDHSDRGCRELEPDGPPRRSPARVRETDSPANRGARTAPAKNTESIARRGFPRRGTGPRTRSSARSDRAVYAVFRLSVLGSLSFEAPDRHGRLSRRGGCRARGGGARRRRAAHPELGEDTPDAVAHAGRVEGRCGARPGRRGFDRPGPAE